MLTLFILKLAGIVTAAAGSTGAAVGVWYLHRRWNLRLSELELQQITALAEAAVAAAEQRHKDVPKSASTDRQKLDFAIRNLFGHLKRVGIKLDRTAAEGMIEAQVNRLRNRDVVTTEIPLVGKRDLAWTARDT